VAAALTGFSGKDCAKKAEIHRRRPVLVHLATFLAARPRDDPLTCGAMSVMEIFQQSTRLKLC
jgi:hypothetical protein